MTRERAVRLMLLGLFLAFAAVDLSSCRPTGASQYLLSRGYLFEIGAVKDDHSAAPEIVSTPAA